VIRQLDSHYTSSVCSENSIKIWYDNGVNSFVLSSTVVPGTQLNKQQQTTFEVQCNCLFSRDSDTTALFRYFVFTIGQK